MDINKLMQILAADGRQAVVRGLLIENDPIAEARKLWDAGKKQMAIDLLKRQIDQNPSRADWWIQLGIFEMDVIRYEQALHCFRKAARLDPYDPHARGLQAGPLECLGYPKAAERANREALEMESWRKFPSQN